MTDNNLVSTTVGDRLIVFLRPTTVGSEASTTVTFPTGWIVNVTASSLTVTTDSLPSTIHEYPVTALSITDSAAASIVGQTATFAHADLTVGRLYAFAITGGIATPDVASTSEYTNGLVTSHTSTAATIDQSEWATQIFQSTTGHSIAVSATVDANFEYTLDTMAIAFGTLSGASIASSSGNAVTIATNAEGGWTILVKSANKGLTSTAESNTIAATGAVNGAPSTISANTQDYGLDVNVTTNGSNGTGGAPTAAAEYNAAANQIGSLNADAFQEAAHGDGTTDGDVVSLVLRAVIGDRTIEATDYADTLTVVGAGSF